MNLQQAIEELKKGKERKFDETVDLLVNLKGVDPKRDNVNIVVTIPHKIKDKKVAGFLSEKSKLVKTITEPEFKKYSEKKEMRKLVKEFDYFIAIPKLMPKVATAFGKVLGPAGKMPSPQLGLVMQENDANIQATLDKIATSLKIRMKEASIKAGVGKISMSAEHLSQNVQTVYTAIENALPKKKESVKTVMIKTTMGKPIKVDM